MLARIRLQERAVLGRPAPSVEIWPNQVLRHSVCVQPFVIVLFLRLHLGPRFGLKVRWQEDVLALGFRNANGAPRLEKGLWCRENETAGRFFERKRLFQMGSI